MLVLVPGEHNKVMRDVVLGKCGHPILNIYCTYVRFQINEECCQSKPGHGVGNLSSSFTFPQPPSGQPGHHGSYNCFKPDMYVFLCIYSYKHIYKYKYIYIYIALF